MDIRQIVALIIGFFMAGILVPIALEAWESFTPTDATLGAVYIIVPILFLVGVGLYYLPGKD